MRHGDFKTAQDCRGLPTRDNKPLLIIAVRST
jgi:hypothetical protein